MKKLLLLFCFFSSSTLFAQTGSWLWASHTKAGWAGLGSSQNLIAVDNAGNCFYTGYLSRDTIKFGAYTLMESDPGDYDIFLVKFDQNGNVIWAKQSTQNGNTADGNGYVVSLDGLGNTYIMANFENSISFDSYMLTANQGEDNFLAKYDPNGNVVWARQSQIPSSSSQIDGNSLATDKKGNSYITGLFHDTAYFGANMIKGFSPTFLVKYDADGYVKWAAQSTGHSNIGSDGTCVAANNSDGVFISGWFYDSVTFGSFKLTCPSTIVGNSFIVKYDTNGNVKWAKAGTIPSSHNFAQARGITADNFGNVYVTGLFWDTLIFVTDTLITKNYNVFLVKYDSNGNVKWATSPHILDNNNWGPSSLSSDNKGDIYMAGGGGGTGLCKICFGNDTLSINDTSHYSLDSPTFVVKFDSSGKVLCASINLCGGNNWNGISSDTSGNYVYFGGIAHTVAVFGKDTIDPFDYYGDLVPFVARWEECDATLGVNDIAPGINNTTVKVYPNPNNGQFTLAFSHPELVSGSQTITIYNVLGEQVYNATLKQVQGDNTIDLTGQPNGIYLYRVSEENGNLIGEGKLIIRK